MSGDLTVGNDEQGKAGHSYSPNTYACGRPAPTTARSSPGTAAMLFEIHYFDPKLRDCCPQFSALAAAKSCITTEFTTRALRVVAGVLRLRPTKRGTPAVTTAPMAAMSPCLIAASAV